MSLALVTGGGGFLGRYIVQMLLEDDWQVRILGRSLHQDLIDQGVEQVQGDISDKEKVLESCEGCESVFHVAAKAGIWGSLEEYEKSNVQGSLNVLEACQTLGIPKLIYTSSPSVVFSGKDQVMLDENTPYPKDYLCHYPRTKAKAEELLLKAHKPGVLHVVALRPHLIWGLGDNHLIPRLLQKAQSGQLAIVGDGKNRVDMVHVKNAAYAHILAEQNVMGAAGGKTYFVTNDEPILLWEWINELLSQIGLPKVKKRVPYGLAYFVGNLMEKVYTVLGKKEEPRMTRFVAQQLATHHTYQQGNIQKDLNYYPLITMQEGVKEMLEAKDERPLSLLK